MRLPAKAFSALETFLAIRVPLAGLPRLVWLRSAPGFTLAARWNSSRRAPPLIDARPWAGAIIYDAAFGRPLDYYTGLVFETPPLGAARALVGGGRYDRLLTMLGAVARFQVSAFRSGSTGLSNSRERRNDHHLGAPFERPSQGTGARRVGMAGLSVDSADRSAQLPGAAKAEEPSRYLFPSASEIARELGYGSVDLGVTGEDLIRETLSSADERVEIEAASALAMRTLWLPCPRSGTTLTHGRSR